ncbi:hypothetical protein [Neorhizobium tomejilense]|uniref:hypothetical protein n=1 Tax=Neorhizobium tomejilense TaxID=2093828 RepID=UPI00197B6F58|nr:hypothetical protein [Neorhizobium tomejilense]
MLPHSFYAAYHVPTGSLRICHAERVLRQYEHAEKEWSEQRSLTVTFTDELTVEHRSSRKLQVKHGWHLNFYLPAALNPLPLWEGIDSSCERTEWWGKLMS